MFWWVWDTCGYPLPVWTQVWDPDPTAGMGTEKNTNLTCRCGFDNAAPVGIVPATIPSGKRKLLLQIVIIFGKDAYNERRYSWNVYEMQIFDQTMLDDVRWKEGTLPNLEHESLRMVPYSAKLDGKKRMDMISMPPAVLQGRRPPVGQGCGSTVQTEGIIRFLFSRALGVGRMRNPRRWTCAA